MIAGGTARGAPPELVVALINNMPAAAKRATRHQFAGLLAAASLGLDLRIRFMTADRFLDGIDETLRRLDAARPDALIVTGDQPQNPAIADEPLLPALARLAGWAADRTISASWSCLAAHAVVFALDRVERVPLPQKLSGMYSCEAASDHPLLAGFPPSWTAPHSRYNGVDERDLRATGYAILSRGDRIGADGFVKTVRGSLFLFLQGHPEYAPETLFNEYRRDVRRFLAGELDDHPAIPENYFDARTASRLETLRRHATRAPREKLLASLDAVPGPVRDGFSAGARLYANWLALVAERKIGRAVPEARRGTA